MCYGIRTDEKKDVSKLSSVKEESVFTPREDIDGRKTSSLMSESGVTAMFHKLIAPLAEEKGGTWKTDDTKVKSTSAVERDVEKVD